MSTEAALLEVFVRDFGIARGRVFGFLSSTRDLQCFGTISGL